MTNKEYLCQAYWLDQRIHSYLREAANLRGMSDGISAVVCRERVQMSRSGEAPFVCAVEQIAELEDTIRREVASLVALRRELSAVIKAIPNREEQTVLRLRYLCGMKWEDIAADLGVNPRTVRRWHEAGLSHVVQPEK